MSLVEVVLKESLRKSVQRINHKLPVAVCEEAMNEVLRIACSPVTPCMGVWIETSRNLSYYSVKMSHPACVN